MLPHEHKYAAPWHKIVSVLAIAAISIIGLEGLLYINNLYQPVLYVQLSAIIYLFLLLWLVFIFDLHYKTPLGPGLNMTQALKHRFRYMLRWEHFRHFQNYMILPGIIYWGSIIVIGINFGHGKLQQYVVIASGLALIGCYSLFKEIFHNKETPISSRSFLVLSYAKLYAAWLIYSAALGIVWFYCFPANVFYLVVYLVTFMLLYQALFQFAAVNYRNILFTAVISLVVAAASIFVYKFWNVNYFSAGLFLTAIYNLFWGLMYHSAKKTLRREVVLEQLAIFTLIVVMVFGVTDFHARILRCV